MPVIRVRDATFRRLQAMAEPLVDTPSDVIDRLLDSAGAEISPEPEATIREGVPIYAGDAPPPLNFTRITEASIGGMAVESPNWNRLVQTLLQRIVSQGVAASDLAGHAAINAVEGVVQDEGFRPVPRTGLSLQGLSSDDAWRAAVALARDYGLPLRIGFRWRERAGAAHPGVFARMELLA